MFELMLVVVPIVLLPIVLLVVLFSSRLGASDINNFGGNIFQEPGCTDDRDGMCDNSSGSVDCGGDGN